MKSLKRVIWMVFLVAGIQACSGVQVSQDYQQGYNFSGLKTFAWNPNEKNGYGIENNDLVDKRIRSAIENKLLEKSYRLVDSYTPDFFISYYVTVEQKVSNSGGSGGISIGRSSSRGRYGSIGMSTGSAARSYEQGTLLIDVTIPLEDQLVWRGIGTQSVSVQAGPDESAARINEVVGKILAQFPPKQAVTVVRSE